MVGPSLQRDPCEYVSGEEVFLCSHGLVYSPRTLVQASTFDGRVQGAKTTWITPEDNSNVRKMMAKFEAGGERAATLPSRMSLGENTRDVDNGRLPILEQSVTSHNICGCLDFPFSRALQSRGNDIL